jgi:hypothetical protein
MAAGELFCSPAVFYLIEFLRILAFIKPALVLPAGK